MTVIRTPAQQRRRSTVRADGSPARTTKRRAQTRARLLDAAFAVFAARGFGRASIEEVCAAAGFTRGAFYSNFDSLDELFFALYDDRAELIAGQITDAVRTADPAEPVDSLLDRVAHTLLLDRDWLLVKTDFLLYAARDPAVSQLLVTHRARLRGAISQLLRGLGERGGWPPVLGDADGAARAVVAAYDGVSVQLLLDADTAGARAWLSRLLTALLREPATGPSTEPATEPATEPTTRPADTTTGRG